MSAPLAGIRVADFSELLPGPFMTQALVELGAEVIKIERPPQGDPVRAGSPGLFGTVNRGKRSRMLDLKSETGRTAALELAAGADIVVEGYRPGVMARLGLDYAAVQAVNPRVIYLSLTGYGQDGPLRLVPGHDLNYLASAGVTSLCGELGGPPQHGIGLPVADLGGAMYALSAILAALYQRERSGEGQYLDVSMTDCIAHWLNTRKGVCQFNGMNSLEDQRQVALSRPAYGVFACRDGAITIAALETHFWMSLVEVLGLRDFAGADYEKLARRVQHCAPINAAISSRTAALGRDEAVALLLARDIPASPVLTIAEANASAHFQARGLAQDGPVGPLTPFPVRLRGMSPAPDTLPELTDAKGGKA